MKPLKNLLPVMLLALLMACEKQEATYPEPNQETDDRNVRLESLTIDELPQLVGAIEKRGSKMGWASKSEGGDIVLDGSRVLAVTDSVGNRTYSLRMYVPGTPHNVFYNVVGKQTHDGVQNEPFVLRYEVDEDYWPEYAAGPRQEKPFRGKIGLYNLETFGLQNMQEGRTGGTPEPCYEAIADGNGNGGSGGNNSGGSSNGGTDHDPGSDYQYWNTYAPDNGGGSGGREPFVEVGEGRFGDFGTDGTWKRALTGKSADCPEEETLLPINEDDEKIGVDVSVDPCVKGIINKLKTKDMQNLTVPNIGQLAGTGHLSQTIIDMFDGSTNYHLNFKVADATTSGGLKRNAYTDPNPNTPNKGEVTFDIVLDEDFVKNATQLAIARTIIHESLHAYLSYSVQNYSSAPFSQLFYDYVSTKGYTTNTAQHNIMTQFADAIGHSLSVWDNNKQSIEYYKNLAWSGDMLNTTAFNKLSLSRQSSIKNANKNEGNAAYPANSNAKGIKCP
ncbi:hypothetical protein PP180_08000 [Muricauda sp. SK9]|nr:hypothetical protein [Muricauda sp. SK9]MDC6385307.1 hypothetical protein [Muricauda sp. SK9]